MLSIIITPHDINEKHNFALEITCPSDKNAQASISNQAELLFFSCLDRPWNETPFPTNCEEGHVHKTLEAPNTIN